MVRTEVSQWECAAIDHGLTIFPDGKVGPCCQISADYLKPMSVIADPKRFADLHTEHAPAACEKCVRNEHDGVSSYRQFFNQRATNDIKNIAFLDLRNTNLCNLKCRYCGPHFSNQWAKELKLSTVLRQTEISPWLSDILTEDLRMIYFTGGEPLISHQHWNILQHLIDHNLARQITLMYNTNLTQLQYKDLNIVDIWDNFSAVKLMISMDAVGDVFNNIRSGACWQEVERNLRAVISNSRSNNIQPSVSCVLSILNIWHLEEFISYCHSLEIDINFILLQGPDYLALDVIPDALKPMAIDKIDRCIAAHADPVLHQAKARILDNQNQNLFQHCVAHVLFLDRTRKENLFEYLPFQDIAQDLLTRNHEYE